jgi:hypothetical protein
MTAYKIDAMKWQSVLVPINIIAAGNTLGHIPHQTRIATDKTADHIAIAAVSLSPAQAGKRSHLIKTRSIPGFSNHWHLIKRIRKFDAPGQRQVGLRSAVFAAGKDAGKIEEKTVNVHLFNPIFQTMHNELRDQRMITINSVATTGVISIVFFVLWVEMIKSFVQETLEVNHRAILIAFRRMIEKRHQE